MREQRDKENKGDKENKRDKEDYPIPHSPFPISKQTRET
jgi:hypothetical protein